ncbi:Argonaute [Ganoderma sinense ZZ0214-1]|uniref:Argonaute n=1 Tax=Ganoderma sinense ZZ0214-1 TaxID=1077348 RepID=A0A2G8RP11_9APHY|nr:Argonaute [Ganoderma sinense ZZ0214-1]
MADMRRGIVLWQGYFQSVRPALGRMLVNVDVSAAAMYKPGRLIDISLEVLPREIASNGPLSLSTMWGLPESERMRLRSFFRGVRINVDIPGQPSTGKRRSHVVKGLTVDGASQISFKTGDGQTTTIGPRGVVIPMECCTIPAGQVIRKKLLLETTKNWMRLATMKPHDRLQSIRAAPDVLRYSESDYTQGFNMHVKPNAEVESVQARVLDPPVLIYGIQSRQPTIIPPDGSWNMINKTFFRPSTIDRWVVVVYESEQRFSRETAYGMVFEFLQQFIAFGITCNEIDPLVLWEQPTNVAASLQNAGMKVIEKHWNKGSGPDLMIVVLPDSSPDIYRSVKHFGDVVRGVATQCLRSTKCIKANKQYFANVCLKINAKMGGINTIADPRAFPVLTDPKTTIVMGGHIRHPAPAGHRYGPSFAALVCSVDSEMAKYIADCRVQTSRKDMIEELEAMATAHIAMFKSYQQNVEKKSPGDPDRVIFYRAGVSEGQFKHVLELELPQLKRALAANNVKADITVVGVSKGHHVRFFPQSSEEGDKSGNCPVGTVVDRSVTHPTDFDFYLQSHRTTRPAHYNVLYDENKFTPDALQSLSFALCHVYARCTRSVSIPAPIYYARIANARAKNHYHPEGPGGFHDDDAFAMMEPSRRVDALRASFMPVNQAMKRVMYFC